MTRELQLSQSGLAALARCPRRFYLRYVRHLEWPAPLTGSELEWEASLRRGERFHLLVQQHALGLDVEGTARAGDPVLATWWGRYLAHPPPVPAGRSFTEVELEVPFRGHRLVARFDRLVIDDRGGVYIVDWKTGRPAAQPTLERSWQTAVYCYVATEAVPELTRSGAPQPPEGVVFVYWQAEAPGEPVALPYSRHRHQQAGERIAAAVARLEHLLPSGEEAFERTSDLGACRHCPYRSYCERGRETPPGLEFDGEEEVGVPWLDLAADDGAGAMAGVA